MTTTESLYGMALYDFDSIATDVGLISPRAFHHSQTRAPSVFHPVDDYKDLSLREILDLSDDFLANEEDNIFSSHELAIEPVPFNSMSSSDYSFQVGHTQARNTTEDPIFDMQQPNLTLTTFNSKKRSRDFDDATHVSEDCPSEERRFRPYQAGQWAEKFEELCLYKDKYGHCLVPHTYHENLALARWVKRQRYQYKLMMEKKSSTMTEDRVKALEEIGFVWDSQGAAWGERLGELQEFRNQFLHCNVPSNYNENPRLATWIKCQRRQYKLFMENKPSNMTTQRIQHLENLGFEWELRSYSKKTPFS